MIGFRCYNLSIQCSKGGERLRKEMRRRPSVGERERGALDAGGGFCIL